MRGKTSKKKIFASVAIGAFILLVAAISILLTGRLGRAISDPEILRATAARYGIWSFLFFIAVNVLQIFFAPVPGHLVNFSSGLVFGTFRGIIVSWIGVAVGGTAVMLLTRHVGRRILRYVLDDRAARFEQEAAKRGLPLIAFLAVLPNPVGDGLFYLAGITNLPLYLLVPLILLGRLPGIVITVAVGDRLYGSGGAGWIISIAGLILVSVGYLLWGRKLEKVLERLIVKKN